MVGSRFSARVAIPVGLLLLAIGLFATSGLWLGAMGSALVYDEGPAKAEAAVVLAGDYWGNRLVRAAELVQQGYVPVVLVSGPPGIYGTNEGDLAIQWAVRHGYPANWFVVVPHRAPSTKTEAVVMLEELLRRNVHEFLLVTSTYHTARARRIYLRAEEKAGGGPAFRSVASRDLYFSANGWWHTREGRKIAFLEWLKTITGAVGI